jgi:hypothetical protein
MRSSFEPSRARRRRPLESGASGPEPQMDHHCDIAMTNLETFDAFRYSLLNCLYPFSGVLPVLYSNGSENLT